MKSFYFTHIHRSDESASFRWGLGLCAVLLLMPVLGSVMSGVLSVLCLLALFYIFNGYKTLQLTTNEWAISLIFSSYVFISLGFALLHDNPWDGLSITANNSGFIAILFLMPVVRKFGDGEPHWFENGIIGAGIVLLFLAPVEFFAYPGNRVELLSSNPLVLSWMAGVIAIFSMSLVFSTDGIRRMAAVFSMIGAITAVVLAGGRGPIIALVITAILLFIYHVRNLQMRSVVITSLVAIAMVAGTLQLARDNRTLQVMQERFVVGFQQLTGNAPDEPLALSIRIRIVYYTNGWRAFLAAPISGYGRQNIMRERPGDIVDEEVAAHKLTHLHNAYLTEAVASGILGVLALLAVTITPIIAARRKQKRVMEMAVAFTIFTSLCFMTNIGFYHDVMVFFFCVVIVFLNRQKEVNS